MSEPFRDGEVSFNQKWFQVLCNTERISMAKIYLSYSHKDSDFAQPLAAQLKQSGHEITVDVETLSPGQDWRRALSEGLKNSDVFIVLLSKNSLSSQYTLHEIGAARAYSAESERMLIIPIAIDEMYPSGRRRLARARISPVES